MNIRENVIHILNTIKPNKDMTDITDIIDGGYLDSFELLALIAQVSEVFEIEIETDDIIPENFNSVTAISDLVTRLISNKG